MGLYMPGGDRSIPCKTKVGMLTAGISLSLPHTNAMADRRCQVYL